MTIVKITQMDNDTPEGEMTEGQRKTWEATNLLLNDVEEIIEDVCGNDAQIAASFMMSAGVSLIAQAVHESGMSIETAIQTIKDGLLSTLDSRDEPNKFGELFGETPEIH